MKEWFTAVELAGLPGMPEHVRTIGKMGASGRLTRRHRAVGKGWEYHISSLPEETQAYLRAQDPYLNTIIPVRLQAMGNQGSGENILTPAVSRSPGMDGAGGTAASNSGETSDVAAGLARHPLSSSPAATPPGGPGLPLGACGPHGAEGLFYSSDGGAPAGRDRPARAALAPRRSSPVAGADLWTWAASQTDARRALGAERAGLVHEVVALIAAGDKRDAALAQVAAAHAGLSVATLKGWYLTARRQAPENWAAALIPAQRGRRAGTQCSEIHPGAWDWFLTNFLNRGQPTVTEVYRRLHETAAAQGWQPLPSLATVLRRVHAMPIHTLIYHRKGKEALALLIPRQRRDNRVYAPGEAVNGDGLKFDKLYVRWPDGEVLNTSTAWVWQDLRTGKLLSWRIAKTECTDLFRLATYDLTGICLPTDCWLDNTTVAANLAMTGGAAGRHRFAHARRADDYLGLLQQVGITPHFTDPSREYASPGSKRIERAFGTGGLHSEVAHSPRLANRGWSKETAIPYDEFAAVAAEEVARFNARPKRRDPECAGVKSYDDLWAELWPKAVPRIASEAQRRLLLTMVEICRADKDTGEVQLKAGSSHLGKSRYWSDWMPAIRGREVAVYYDPADLQRSLTVHSLDGLKLGEAARLADAGHNDTEAAGEARRVRIRAQKAMKRLAQDDLRMDVRRAQELYPEPAAAPEVPPPGVVRGRFGTPWAREQDPADPAGEAGEEETDAMEAQFQAAVASMAAARARRAI